MAKPYETVIGLEVHVELATRSKIFCACSTRFGGAPNAHTCPVCTGMPGTLPVLNRQVVEYAVAAGLALNCRINQLCKFDRKNYFYPDNPQNYQITQLYLPVCHDGWMEIETEAGKKRVGIHEIHMEEDAGKLIHDAGEGCSLVDYNRSGVPLIEIVTEPDMESAEEATAFLEKLRLVIQYLGASDCKLQEGSMRADVNLSVREAGSRKLGVRTEMKNLNSFKAIARAVEGERRRQIELLEEGKIVDQETRRWDDSKGLSTVMRSKEEARDYRYFPDPDLPPVFIDETWIQAVRNRQPELRTEKIKRYQEELGLPPYDAKILTSSKQLADLFEAASEACKKPKEVSNWLMVEAMRLMKDRKTEPDDLTFSPENLAKLVVLVDNGTVNRTVAKMVFEKIFDENVDPVRFVAQNELGNIVDEDSLRSMVKEVLRANPQSVSDYQNGKEKALGFLVGQTMRALRGKADPGLVNKILKELLQRP